MSELVPTQTAPSDLALSDTTRARIIDGFAANTRKAYTRQWQAFTDWCGFTGRRPVPATAETLAEYVGYLGDTGLSRSTIEQAIATIRTAHRTAGHDNQPDTRPARLVLKSVSRERAQAGRRQKKAPPVSIDALRAMINTCDPSTLIGLRDRVVLVLGLALMGRRSELVALNLDDIRETADGLLVLIRTSKTDQEGIGEEVALPYGQHPDTCPVRVVRAWVAALAEHGITTGRLVRSVSKAGRIGASLSDQWVGDIVRGRAVAALLTNAEKYSAHSLRAGGATSAYKAGAPVSTIAEHGRWAEGSPVVLGYIRAEDKWKDNPIRGIGL